ncbi:MAG: diguanylate cyclase [Gemmatimonadetes bacterium]|nr:diguanylate cyclase [Gemmatimonadota bacterium]
MSSRKTLVYFSPSGRPVPPVLLAFAQLQGLDVAVLTDPAEVDALVNRTLPGGVVIDTSDDEPALLTVRNLKRDPFSAIVPVAMIAAPGREHLVLSGLEAGADEVLTGGMEEREQILRLRVLLHRADRDVSVHPTTRLPGTIQIERDIAARIRQARPFAVCYADLDHFKEFNDRYGYNEGDRVIRVLARILRDVVRGHSPDGFVGHIGGDDFIFNVPLEQMRICCEEAIEIFDTIIPYQYTLEDRQAGYFLGRDRRGNIVWVPLMTLSIGVVTNEHRTFEHTARVSELATEMKAFAKKLPGSVYAVDRRTAEAAPYYGRTITTTEELEAPAES